MEKEYFKQQQELFLSRFHAAKKAFNERKPAAFCKALIAMQEAGWGQSAPIADILRESKKNLLVIGGKCRFYVFARSEFNEKELALLKDYSRVIAASKEVFYDSLTIGKLRKKHGVPNSKSLQAITGVSEWKSLEERAASAIGYFKVYGKELNELNALRIAGWLAHLAEKNSDFFEGRV